MFKCDPHVHTEESSICGKIPAKEIVRLYKDAGFSTIFITDHVDYRRYDEKKDIPFKEQMDYVLNGYYTAKKEGEKIGLTVLFATEIMIRESFNHYLAYGIKPEFLYKCEHIFDITSEELYAFLKENGAYVVQAHPYRDEKCLPYPNCADAFEVYNSHPRHRNHNEEALEAAIKYDKPQTAGSDTHQLPDVALSGIITKNKIESAEDYIAAVKNQTLEIIW